MSLKVSPILLEKARAGFVEHDEFVDCIRQSLPYAWSMVERLANELESSGSASVQNLEVPPDDQAWGEVFRLVGSDAMRGAVQDHYGVKLAFQNCCKVALFRPEAAEEYEAFVSPRAQLLNQRADLLNC